ncbi:hypothetical protein JCM19046_4313 [Bacillus sp. JCM 19046]|nr:hypothetical protein JCM19045_3228 [Bacillus sp. JCM 19045]GAF19649.1 hypothetical protein JCM19046_4313 [Bacillus sp. JCM 19046]
MFKLVTGIVHALYLLMITLYMILAQFSVSSPDETPRNYDLFFFLIITVLILIGFSWVLNYKLGKIWLLIISVLAIPFIFQFAFYLWLQS